MLDPWIIEQIRRREQEERRQQPTIDLPLDDPAHWPPGPEPVTGDSDQGTERGVVIISM